MRYRHLRRTTIAVLATVAILLGGLLLAARVLSDARVRAAATRWLEVRVARATGVHLSIGDLEWGLLPPRLTLTGVEARLPGLTVRADRVSVDVADLRLARRTLELGTVSAHGVHLRLDAGELPRGGGGGSPWLRLVVRHLELDDVTVEGSDLPGGLAVGVTGLEAAWSATDGPPRGFLRAPQVRLDIPGMARVAGDLSLRFSLDNGLRISLFRFSSPGVALRGDATLARDGRVHVTAGGPLELAEVDRVTRVGGILQGSTEVRLVLDTGADDFLHARFTSPRVRAAGFPVDDLEGHIGVGTHGVTGVLDRARFHGGRLSGTYRLHSLDSPHPHEVHLRAEGVDLEPFLRDFGVPAAGLAARLDVTAQLAWDGKHIKAGNGLAEAVLHPASGRLPVGGPLRCELRHDGLLHFAGDDLTVAGSHVEWEGPLTMGSWEPSWSIAVNPGRLREIVSLVNGFLETEVLPPELDGDAEVHLTMAGPWHHLRVAARVEARALVYPPIALDHLTAELLIDGRQMTIGPAAFRLGDGDGEVAGSVTWRDGAGDDQLDLTMRGRRIPLDRVAAWLGQEDVVTGSASFAGGLRGSIERPHGSWALGLVGAQAAGLDLGDASATMDLENGIFTAKSLAFERGLAGTVQWNVLGESVAADLRWPELPLSALGDAAVRLLGEHAALAATLRWPLDGVITGTATLTAPHGAVRAAADDASVTVHGELAGLADLTATLGRSDGGLAGEGTLAIASVGGLLDRVLPGRGIPVEGSSRVALHLNWPAEGRPRLDGRVTALELVLGGRPVRLESPGRFTVGDDGFTLAGLGLTVDRDEVRVALGVAGDGGLSGRLQGTLDALLLRLVVPEWEPAGRLAGDVRLLGTVAQPLLEGKATVTGASFRLPGSSDVFSGLTGTVRLAADEALIDDMGFRFMHGSGRAAGRVALSGGTVELELAGHVDGIQYPVFPGLVPRLSGDWRLRGPVDQLELAGSLVVDRAMLRRKDDLATILTDWFANMPSGGGATSPTLDLSVRADRTIEAQTPFVHLVGSADLHLTGTPADIGIVGQLEFLEGGDFTFQGVRYELDRAVLTFSDPGRIDPYIEVRARAWVQIYEVTVTLTGTVDRLVPALSSDPPLPEGEIVSLLAMGRRDEGGDSGSSAVGVGLASTLLTREINAELEKRARSLLSVDQVRVDPFAEVSTGNPAARITVVKQLSPTWTVVVQSNLSANREEAITSRWLLGPGLFLEANRDVDGTYGLDLKLRRRY